MLRSICLALAILALGAPAASAVVTSSFSAGTLTVSASAAEGITITCATGKVSVNFASIPGNPDCADVLTTNVNGGTGANTIVLSAMTSSNFPSAAPITIDGNAEADQITGSQLADAINGDVGGDTVDGQGGNDTITTTDEGGPDTLGGGAGTNDVLSIDGNLAQFLTVGPTEIVNSGSNITFSGIERGVVDGPAGEPQYDLTNSPFPWTVNGGSGNETVWTSPHDDILNLGSEGIDDIVGSKIDSPSILVSAGGMSGDGIGNDTLNNVEEVRLISPTTLGTSTTPVDSVWDASLSIDPVIMSGGSGNDTFIGGFGNDTLGAPTPNPSGFEEETGNDIFDGNNGSDTLHAGPGDDTIRKVAKTDVTVGASSITADGDTDSFNASEMEVVSVSGTSNVDEFNASAFGGRAIFSGLGAGDTLVGTHNNDRMTGGAGSDDVEGNNGTDTVVETATVQALSTLTPTSLTGFGGTDAFTSIERAELTGSADGDVIDASAFDGPVILSGLGGADSLTGGPAADRLLGGAGDDTFTGGGGTDTVAEIANGASTATLTPTTLTGFGGTEDLGSIERAELSGSGPFIDVWDASTFPGPVIFNSAGAADTLTGGLAADTLLAGSGDDTLNTGEGTADLTIDCGADTDTANVDNADPTPVDCEAVNKPVDPGPGPGPGGDPPGGDPPGGDPPGGDPPVTDSQAPAMTITAARVDRRGRVKVRFACPADETSCAGTFRLRAKRGKKTITVGRGEFTVVGGQVVAVRIRLNKAGRKLLRKRKRLKATVVGSATDAAGNAAQLNSPLTLKPKPRRRR
jgi:Ca2+-binding RTX toxin-like protein